MIIICILSTWFKESASVVEYCFAILYISIHGKILVFNAIIINKQAHFMKKGSYPELPHRFRRTFSPNNKN